VDRVLSRPRKEAWEKKLRIEAKKKKIEEERKKASQAKESMDVDSDEEEEEEEEEGEEEEEEEGEEDDEESTLPRKLKMPAIRSKLVSSRRASDRPEFTTSTEGEAGETGGDTLQRLVVSLESISKVSSRYLRLVEIDRGLAFDPVLGDYIPMGGH
jgi:hypothetical protein